MTLSHRALPILLLIALLLAACSPSPKLPALPPDGVILAFGDSLTYGTGAGEGQSYPAVLASLSGHEVVNAGIPGEISAKGLARLPALLDEVQPSLLILCHGGNDMLQKLDLGQTEANLRAMIDEAKQRNIPVVLIGVPKPGLLLGTAEFYDKVAKEMHVPIEDEALPSILSKGNLKSDYIHPNAAGYRLMAQSVLTFLQKFGAL
ncbi:MAG TPA: arylesterase [Mariprofundaceae bacterium]|nr:arylesterase [Mariprofundaceae bacterium]